MLIFWQTSWCFYFGAFSIFGKWFWAVVVFVGLVVGLPKAVDIVSGDLGQM